MAAPSPHMPLGHVDMTEVDSKALPNATSEDRKNLGHTILKHTSRQWKTVETLLKWAESHLDDMVKDANDVPGRISELSARVRDAVKETLVGFQNDRDHLLEDYERHLSAGKSVHPVVNSTPGDLKSKLPNLRDKTGAAEKQSNHVHEAESMNPEKYLHEEVRDGSDVHLTMTGLPYEQPGRILLREFSKSGKAAHFYELGSRKQIAPKRDDVILDITAENLRLLSEAYFLIRERKAKLRDLWKAVNKHRVGMVVVLEDYEAAEDYELLDKIVRYPEQQYTNSKHLVVTVLEAKESGAMRREGRTITARRLLLVRGYDNQPEDTSQPSRVYIQVSDGAVVQRMDTDVVLPETENTYRQLAFFLDQTLLPNANFFPELQTRSTKGPRSNKRPHPHDHARNLRPSKKPRVNGGGSGAGTPLAPATPGVAATPTAALASTSTASGNAGRHKRITKEEKWL
jgi:hypothetical protein